MSNATLMTHAGAQEVTRAQLGRLPKPKPGGPYHQPVPHIELVTTIEEQLKKLLDAKVTEEKFAIARGGSLLFGTMTLSYGERKDLTCALGLRQANDRTLPIQLVGGVTVFVCDNMALSGDHIILKKRHTTHLDLAAEVAEGLGQLKAQYAVITEGVGRLKARKLNDDQAKALMFDAFIGDRQGVMATRFLPQVAHEYFEPRHEEFKPRTAWSLHNAFTEVLKALPMSTRLAATSRLGKLFELGK